MSDEDRALAFDYRSTLNVAPPRSYRDYLARAPLAIKQTEKRPGDLVLGNALRPAWRVPGTSAAGDALGTAKAERDGA